MTARSPRETRPTRTAFAAAAALALGMAAPLGAAGADFDGSKKLICSPSGVYECLFGQECKRVEADNAAVPEFIRVDFKKKRLTAVLGERTTAIQNIQKMSGNTIVQGAENGRGWTLTIDAESGAMSATVSDEGVGFVVFGACMVD